MASPWRRRPPLAAPVLSLAAGGGLRLTAAGLADGSVKILDLTASDAAALEWQSIAAGTRPVQAIAFLPDRSSLLTGGDDKTLNLWNLGQPGESRVLAGHTAQVYSVAWSADGKQITTGAADKTLRQWDAAKAAQVRQWNAHASVVYTVAYSPKGDLLASGGDDKLIKYWNPADGKEVRKSVGHGAPVYCLSFAPTARSLPRARWTRRSGSGTWPTARSLPSSTAIPTTCTRSPSAPTASGWRLPGMAVTSSSGISRPPSRSGATSSRRAS